MKKFQVFIYFNRTDKLDSFWVFSSEVITGYIHDHYNAYPNEDMTWTVVEFLDNEK